LQQDLNLWLAHTPTAEVADLAEDGIFGPKTEAMVHAFQRATALVDDGIVGQKTWAQLLAVEQAVPPSH
jgi:peptidoglycan hydrolase-like protein with peptidoglycan-binding domain